MTATFRLSRLRLAVQILAFAVTVWGAGIVGHYAAEKLSSTLPALSCAYDQQNGAYCALIPLQHQLHHRVGEAIAKMGTVTAQIILPFVFTLLTFLAFFIVMNKAFCSWICPLGSVQEWINRLGRRFDLPLRRLTGRPLDGVRLVKWAMLGLLVLLLPLLAGMGVVAHEFGDAFCQICPSRVLTTLASGDTAQWAIPLASGPLAFALNGLRDAGFGFVAVAALAVRQPFCRICPMLALHAAFRRLAPLRLTKRPSTHCGTCGLCVKACPMDIRELQTTVGAAVFHEDCTLCGRCVEFCPHDGVMALAVGPWRIFSSNKAYFRDTTRRETADGRRKPTAS